MRNFEPVELAMLLIGGSFALFLCIMALTFVMALFGNQNAKEILNARVLTTTYVERPVVTP